MPDFNLITEKWIPCIKDGKPEELGLQEILINAHQIQEIFDPSPLVTISLHRLLLAILHRNFGPGNLEKWKALWVKKKWDEAILTEYFMKWKHRFDLFDEKRPFYQSLEMEGAKKHPVLHLAMEDSSGNNATLFAHNSDDNPGVITAAEATRYIIATQSFAIGFGKSTPFYFSDSSILRGMTVLSLGNTLFETLCLNLLIYNEYKPFPWVDKDLPIWEQDYPKRPDRNGSPTSGYLDYLTWQSRNIHLFPEVGSSNIRFCQIQQNLKINDENILDPFKCYKKDEKRGIVPINISPDKAVWRDSHALFQISDTTYKRPDVLNFLARIEDERRNKRIDAQSAYQLAIFGLAMQPGKAGDVLLWRHEHLPLPLKYLVDEALIFALKEALEFAEKVSNILNSSAWNLAKLIIAPNADKLNDQQKKEVDKLDDHLSITRSYWSQLGISFNELLMKLPGDKTEESGEAKYGKNTNTWWAVEVRKAAEDAFQEVTRSLDRSARVLKAVSKAESLFNHKLNETIDSYLIKNEGGEK